MQQPLLHGLLHFFLFALPLLLLALFNEPDELCASMEV